MTQPPHSDLISDIEAFCASRGMSKSAFGKEAMRDPRFVYDLEKGRECLPRTIRKARHFIVTGSRMERASA